ncbi:uncharacterized protein LOC121727547 isoform X2 [Aricia agestis]|uniref:uncharacterized protein LOC121727547 isoform X2 n=1 Tax=Aricia agestis TaxID=91739 RepID=UPI001C208DCA|nr:uncharacterized protein LOC121727547 isoform X2 [Aricia agestis]
MAPMYGVPSYDFLDESSESSEEYDGTEEVKDVGLTEVTFWYMIVLLTLLVTWFLVFFCLRMLTLRQKTRSQQQRRAFTGSRTRPSLSQSEPTIYVSPANLPPPPKYEAMAPPSYEEVVGIHYPQYQIPVQPITVPITTALAQNSTDVSPSGSRTDGSRTEEPQTVITVTTDDRRTVTVATS